VVCKEQEQIIGEKVEDVNEAANGDGYPQIASNFPGKLRGRPDAVYEIVKPSRSPHYVRIWWANLKTLGQVAFGYEYNCPEGNKRGNSDGCGVGVQFSTPNDIILMNGS
jgi:hypothetical protein